VIGPESSDGLLNKAFHLACFILGDRDAALRVVTSALAKLEVAIAAQGKRVYYRPTGRLWARRSQWNRFRNNISFNEPHLLQRLIYIESEPYEIAQEQAKGSAAVGEEDLVIHFIKHLTKKTVKRNSFYVTLGLSRLLYSYNTAETMNIYNAVIQDPERVKDDYYYRSRKGVLMQELKQRFGDLINIGHGPRGEERFEADDNQGRFVELVRECLSFFTPWHTPCLVPAGIDPITDGIPSFSYQGHNEEDKIEVNRIHAVLHPECFERLTADLHFDAPNTRLEIPRFFYANDTNGNGSNSKRRNPPKLDEQELQSITSSLDSNAARRKAASTGLLRIMVDGVEHARIDLNLTRGARFSLDKDAELIEVRSRDNAGEELLLASHLLTPTETENGVQPVDASIILEGGQKIAIHTSPELSDTGTIVEVSYRETDPFRAAWLLFRQLAQSLTGGPSRRLWKDRRVFVAALVIVFVISFAVVMKYIRSESGRATEPNQIAGTQQPGQPKDETRATMATTDGATSTAGDTNLSKSSNPPPQGAEAREQRHGVGPSPKIEETARNSAQEKPVISTGPGTVTETETRSIRALRDTPLSAVKRIYVAAVGDETLSQSVRQKLAERLRATNRIILVHNKDEADALLKITVVKSTNDEPEKTKALAELINARGNVIWSSPSENYQGSPAEVTASIIRDLLAAIKNSKQQK
jgi:hypothetical protein